MKTHTLIVSDIHLGSVACNALALLKMLQGSYYEKLILLGDLHQEGGVITDKQFEFIKYLRKHREKIVYVDGNHDPEGEILAKMIGVDVVKKYEWEIGGKKLCALHGHQFDRWCFIFSVAFIDWLFLVLLGFLKIIRLQSFDGQRWIDNFHQNLSLSFAKKAKKYAKKHKFDAIICGHIHRPIYEEGLIEYANCGSWVQNVCSFVTINECGIIRLHLID